jgi:pimeloyl-ACP methyl ester carboxylesterase
MSAHLGNSDNHSDAVEPFRVDVAQGVLDDLGARLARTRWIDDRADGDWSHGLSVPYLQQLVAYWRTGFDWRAQEASINRVAHFQTVIDEQRVHFIHEHGRGPAPFPLVLTHGFPDSFLRFQELIPLLVDPASSGGDPADSFDIVVPSLPGYAFSDAPKDDGGIFRAGDLWHRLMTERLGYARYGAHGGDWGGMVTELIGRDHADAVIGIHLTDIPFYHAFQRPKDPSHDEKKYLDSIDKFTQGEGAYAMIQGAQPQALALGLNDSPAGLAAWIIEKWRRWSDCGGDVESRFTKDQLLSNVMIYWVTQTINDAFGPYYDIAHAGAITWIKQKLKQMTGSSDVPAGFAMFPKDLSHPPRAWAERFFNVQRWSEMPSGGHFAALEEPALLAREIREFYRSLRAR